LINAARLPTEHRRAPDGIAMSWCDRHKTGSAAAARAARYCLWIVLAVCLSACATPVPPEHPVPDAALPPTQRPYTIFGVWYYPIPCSRGFVEDGFASWYGPGFHGKRTSNGEVYDMHAMTAAHKTLPMGTALKVTRTDTGRSIVVRINDRGPFVSGRIIDLSYCAAQALDMISAGTAPVRIEALQRATEHRHDGQLSLTPEPLPDFRSGTFTIPVGAYGSAAAADAVQQRLAQQGHSARIMRVETLQGVRYRVSTGTFHDLIEAHISAAHFRDIGYPDACVVALDGQ
jgi:rare lipoprotein A